MPLETRYTSIVGATLFLLGAGTAAAERLPFTSYTTTQGLGSDQVSTAIEDRRGFLWLGTTNGLSRFDGREFRTFGVDHEPRRIDITSMAVAPDSTIWLGVWGGVFRFDPARGGSFTEIPVEGRTRQTEGTLLTVDHAGRMWMAFDGLYRSVVHDGRPTLQRIDPGPNVSLPFVSAIFTDRQGVVWAGYRKLYRIVSDRFVPVPLDQPAPPDFEVTSLVQDVHGQIWAGTSRGLWRTDGCDRGTEQERCVLRLVSPISTIRWNTVVPRKESGVWIGTADGLFEIDPSGGLLRRITQAQGLQNGPSFPLLVDSVGDLWIGGGGNGLQRLAARGFTAFTDADGLIAPSVMAILETRPGEIIAVGSPHVLQRFDGRRFESIRPVLPDWIKGPGWAWYQADMQDRRGDWWIPTDGALIRYAAVSSVNQLAHARPRAVYTRDGCFAAKGSFRLYEDSRGDIWIGTLERDQQTLSRWVRESDTFECYDTSRVLGEAVSPTAFLDDGRGTLWIGFYGGQVVRYRKNHLACVLCDSLRSQGAIYALLLDDHGRLWLSTAHSGVLRIDDPLGDHPSPVRMTTADGLASNTTGVIAEDRSHQLYVTTDRGIDVIDQSSDRIQHYGVAEGLPHGLMTVALADSRGNVWFGGQNGLVRFTPTARQPWIAPASVVIDSVRIGNRFVPVSALGESSVGNVVMAPDERALEVDFVALPRSASSEARFQYRLSEGGEWSPPTSSRSIVIAHLSAGDHRIEIRALQTPNAHSSASAVVTVHVLAPFYERAWFLMLIVALGGAVIAVLYRTRVERSLALERQRTRIAMDLHDEMGSGLGSIGLLADLAADEQIDRGRRGHLLGEIAETASEMASSLTDIVWSLRRGQTTMENLARHLAGHGRKLFAAENPSFETRFPDTWPPAELSLAAGRNALLIGLEALHNAADHARAARVVLEMSVEDHCWRLTVRDDGRGFERAAVESDGFGLETMRRRAAEIGGALEIQSRAGQGTRVTLVFDPEGRARRPRRIDLLRLWKRSI